MQIQQIEILNFKGFGKKTTVSFATNMTVVIGNNTAGKTTLLQATQIGLGAFLQSMQSLPGGSAFRRNFAKSDRFLKYNAEKRDYIPNKEYPRIDIRANITRTRKREDGTFLKTDCIRKTPGVVLIDEVDLYLHPNWQRHILNDLQEAFPMIQFIVSTHSPFIVQSLQANQLVSFDADVNTSGSPYKESLEDIAEERMGMVYLVHRIQRIR